MYKYIIIAIIAIAVGFLNLLGNISVGKFSQDIDKTSSEKEVIKVNVASSLRNSTQLPLAKDTGPVKNEEVADPNIEAKAVLVQDLETGKILYAKNENERLPIASITKLMAAQVILDKINLDEIITMSKTAIDTYGGQAFSAGEKISAENLFKAMLLASSNDAAVALSEHISGTWQKFAPLMNDYVKRLGLLNTNFANPTGLDDLENYSSAADMAVMAKESLKYPLIWETMRIQNEIIKSTDGLLEHNLNNSNKLLGKLPNITGGKTGYTEDALETFAFVAGPPRELTDPKDNHQVLYILLGAPIGLRFQETEKLVNWVDKAYQW